MTTIHNTEQVILVTTKSYSSNCGEVRLYDKNDKGSWQLYFKTTTSIGKNGFTDNKQEGDQKTPTGKYTIGHAFGYKENPGTALKFKQATENDIWVDDPQSKFYNTWQSKSKWDKDWKSTEEMTHELYKYGFIINYNTKQTPGKGSAIFMHIKKLENDTTHGCIAMKESNLLKMMKWINPEKTPAIILTPESKLNKY